MSRKFRVLLLPAIMVLPLLLMAACSTSHPGGEPMPRLTFEHVKPLGLDVSVINTDSRYQPGTDPRDVSDRFPMPPDMALTQYVQQRYKPSAESGDGVLNVVVDDMYVYEKEVRPEGMLNEWFGLNDSAHYDIYMAVRLFTLRKDGTRSPHVRLRFNGELKIPERYSIVEREERQLAFLEKFMESVDKSFIKALRDELHILPAHYDAGDMMGAAHGMSSDGENDKGGDGYGAPYGSAREDQNPSRRMVMPQNSRDYNDRNGNGAAGAPESLAPPEMR